MINLRLSNNKKFFLSIIIVVLFTGILKRVFSEEIYQLLFMSPLGQLNNYLFSGFYFLYFYVVYIIYGTLFNIIIAIILATIFFPSSKLKYTIVGFFTILILTFIINMLGISNIISNSVNEIRQKDSFKVISEIYKSKSINGRITPNIIFNVEITNTSNDILEGEIQTITKHPYISVFYCKNDPEYIELESKDTALIEIDCTVPGSSDYEQTKASMKDLPEALNFELSVIEKGRIFTSFTFKSKPHNWAEF